MILLRLFELFILFFCKPTMVINVDTYIHVVFFCSVTGRVGRELAIR